MKCNDNSITKYDKLTDYDKASIIDNYEDIEISLNVAEHNIVKNANSAISKEVKDRHSKIRKHIDKIKKLLDA